MYVLKESLVNKSKYNNRLIMQKLHDYMLENNEELIKYLYDKKEYEDFLITRTDNAIDEYLIAHEANVTDPNEIENQVLFTGVENSCSEYVESMLMELPYEQYQKLKNSIKFDLILKNLIQDCIPIFYEHINTPYSIAQDKLDNEILTKITKSLSLMKF